MLKTNDIAQIDQNKNKNPNLGGLVKVGENWGRKIAISTGGNIWIVNASTLKPVK